MQFRLHSGDAVSMKFVVIVLCLLSWTCCCLCWTPGKVCTGTSFGLRRTGHAGNWSLQRYRRMYENCVYVDGNLEITHLENGLYNLSFLSTIQEVSGYVVIAFVSVTDVIPLRNLRVIRGQTLFSDQNDPNSHGYSVYVANNYVRNSPGVGLKELQLTALREIMNGSVMFDSNYDLCYVDTIAWSDILTGPTAAIKNKLSDPQRPTRQCGECDASCATDEARHCWGAGPDMCQTLIRRCNAQCGDNCYGPEATDCCNVQCVGGCSGPEPTQCYACKHFIDGGECVSACPSPLTQSMVPNPNVKYAHSIVCLARCPEPLVTDHGTCVSDCAANRMPVDGRCQPCDGQCPKACDAPEHINADNIANLTGCTEIRGILRILNSGVVGETRPVERRQLDVLASVETITGALVVKINDSSIADLSFLRNLRTIYGRQLEHGTSAMVIVRTMLHSLGLQSLRSIPHGRIFMGFNSHLCYADTVNWEMITGRVNVTRLKLNGQECGRCSRFCDSNGCWGPGDDQCLQCAGYRQQGRCVQFCDHGYSVNSTAKECWRCHSDCLNSSTGPPVLAAVASLVVLMTAIECSLLQLLLQ